MAPDDGLLSCIIHTSHTRPLWCRVTLNRPFVPSLCGLRGAPSSSRLMSREERILACVRRGRPASLDVLVSSVEKMQFQGSKMTRPALDESSAPLQTKRPQRCSTMPDAHNWPGETRFRFFFGQRLAVLSLILPPWPPQKVTMASYGHKWPRWPQMAANGPGGLMWP